MPLTSIGTALANIARAMLGMPANTNTLSILKPGAADGVLDELGAARNARHFQARLVQRAAAALQALDGFGFEHELDAERERDALGRDVVVRGPMPPVVNTYVNFARHSFKCRTIAVGHVAHDARLL